MKKLLHCWNTRFLEIHLIRSNATVESWRKRNFVFFIRGLFFKNTIGKFECTCIYHSCIYNIIYFLFLYLYEYNINDFKSLWLINVRLIVYRSIEKKNTYGLTNSANKKKYAQQWWDKKKCISFLKFQQW